MAVYDRPVNAFVGSFIGNPPMNFLRGRLQRRGDRLQVALGDQSLDAPPALATAEGREVMVGIRAENIVVEGQATPGALPARAEVVEPAGSHLLVTAALGEQRLKVLTRTDFPVAPESTLWLRPEAERLRWFDPETQAELGVS